MLLSPFFNLVYSILSIGKLFHLKNAGVRVLISLPILLKTCTGIHIVKSIAPLMYGHETFWGTRKKMLKRNIGCEVTLMYFSKVIQGRPSQNFSSMLRKQGSELFIPLEKEHLQWGLQKQCTRTQSLVSGHLKGGGAQPWSSRAYVYQKLGSSLSSGMLFRHFCWLLQVLLEEGMWVLFLVYKSYPSKEKRDMKYISTISSINLTQLKSALVLKNMADETTIHGHTDDHHETSVDDGETLAAGNNTTTRLADRKVSWSKLRRVDSLSLEAGRVSFAPSHHHASSRDNWQRTLHLAFQCIGVIFGDIGTSPLYVYASTFTKINNKNDILGVLSLVIYTIILVPLLKYVCIILWANDNGDGGTFALYSLMCRHMSVSLRPNQEPEDIELSNNRLETPSNELKRAQKIKEKLESSMLIKTVLFLVTMLATSMVIGDGVLTPCVSVLSAVSGVKSLGEDAVMWISIAILVLLFNVQRFGTDKVGYVFAPALCLWFSFICGIGLYTLCRYDITVLHAFNPMYIVDFFRRNGKEGWASLGGIVLCITGTEAMFADLGHFNVRAVQISFSGVVLPAVLIAYCGQAAYLTKYPDHVGNIFYDSIPDPLYWPMFAIAVMAAIIASQALISGAFAIIRQSLSLGCFPRVKVIHTSSKYEGQVYIPEVNWILMILCITVTYSFKTTTQINNAYGIAVVSVMLITTCMVSLIMLVIWKTQIWLVALFFVAFISIEGIYLSAVLYKFTQGGYLPLLFALVLMMVMVVWHYVHKERYSFELNKVSSEYVRDLAKNPEVKRVPGIMLLYSELVEGIPLIFPHYVSNVRSLHSVVVLVSIKYLPVSKLVPEERFLFRQVGPREYRMFRCVVRYGYNDKIEEPMEFEGQLVDHLMEFIRQEHFIAGSPLALENIHEQPLPAEQVDESLENVSARLSSAEIQTVPSTRTNEAVAGWAEDVQFVQHAKEQGGVFYLLGEATVQAKHDSCFFKKLAVNYVYSFLHKNFRQEENAFAVPQNQHLKVGMVYEI